VREYPHSMTSLRVEPRPLPAVMCEALEAAADDDTAREAPWRRLQHKDSCVSRESHYCGPALRSSHQDSGRRSHRKSHACRRRVDTAWYWTAALDGEDGCDCGDGFVDESPLLPGGAARKHRQDQLSHIGRHSKHGGRRRRRVDPRLLRTLAPCDDEQREAEEARGALAAAAEARARGAPLEPNRVESKWKLDWGPMSRAWERLLQTIRDRHEWRIMEELGPYTELLPVYPEEHVQARFLSARRELEHTVSVGYHGTESENIPSIARRGLIIPGRGGVRVANGSAHGLGIYTARLGSARLSKGFASQGSGVFICGLCDTSQALSEEERPQISSTKVMSFQQRRWGPTSIGGRSVTRASEEVLHVGDAMVVFREQCVVPLFLEWQCDLGRENRWEPPQQVGRRRVAMPEEGQGGVVFAAEGCQQRGRTVWLTPPPLVEGVRWARRLRRRRNRRELTVSSKIGRCSRTGAFESE